MILSNTEWRESQKLITEERIKILLQWVDTIFILLCSSPFSPEVIKLYIYNNFLKQEVNVFILIVGGTELGTIPGLSAAGSNPEAVAYTAPADAEVLWKGKPQIIDALPVDPEGHPTPALISRAAYLEAGFPVLIVRAGTLLPPPFPMWKLPLLQGETPAGEKQ